MSHHTLIVPCYVVCLSAVLCENKHKPSIRSLYVHIRAPSESQIWTLFYFHTLVIRIYVCIFYTILLYIDIHCPASEH